MLLAVTSLLAALAQPPADATREVVTGRVIDQRTQSPVPHARVTIAEDLNLRANPNPPRQRETTTDDAGEFVFAELESGRYSIRAGKTGWVMDPFARTAPLDVGAGNRRITVTVAMQPSATIKGRVTDPAGQPSANLSVVASLQRSAAARAGRPGPLRETGGGPAAQTNQSGEFRIDDVPVGFYVVRAMPDPVTRPAGTTRNSNGRPILVTSYYPGSINLTEAQVVEAVAGQTTDLVFAMQTVRSFRVSGRVVDQAGRPAANDLVRLIAPRGERLTGAAITSSARTDTDGGFTIDAVIPGGYSLLVVPPRVRPGNQSASDSAGAARGVRFSLGGPDRQQVRTEWSSDGSTVEFRDTDGVEAPVIVVDADVTDLLVTVALPPRLP